MNIHEYQAKELFADFSVPVQRGGLAETPEQARSVAEMLEGPVWVVKAQIHAGGRGKGGGVKLSALSRKWKPQPVPSSVCSL